MVKVPVEVRSGTARLCESVEAQSIQQATSIVAARYPYSDIRVKFPIDAEGFSSRFTLLE